MKLETPLKLAEYRQTLQEARSRTDLEIILSAQATCCVLRGSRAVARAFREGIERKGLADRVLLRASGCLGFCEIEPMVIIRPGNIVYQRVKPEDAEEILERAAAGDKAIERLCYRDPLSGRVRRRQQDIPFYQKQQRLIIGAHEAIDPTRIEDAIAAGGYASLARVLSELKPEEVIEQMRRAGLRGRGGGGFPTWRKWQACRAAASGDGTRYVICNADEGDPGAYMDRSILEGNPHAVIEGMIIGAYAIGSRQGYVYVRAEYPLAVEHLRLAIEQAQQCGLLGENILGSGHDFGIKIVRGAGAFVCGESTALMLSLEGKVGEPRTKHIHTVESGLFEAPTALNNVETWANVPLIIARGADWYAGIGTAGSKGTKLFSLVGKVNNTGLVEVPMGMTLKDIIFTLGGGVPGGKAFKAVQTGGPSGGCLPDALLDLKVDFDELAAAGSMMGSGGMIVMDEETCMVDVARYFLGFLVEESCGKCTPCREGIYQMHAILDAVTRGSGRAGDIERLEALAESVRDSSLCALGKTAANPVLSTIRYFREEYQRHIEDKQCPAGVCRALFGYAIDEALCTGCTKCLRACPQAAISGKKKEPHHINAERCSKCGICREVCSFGAVVKVPA